MRRRQEQKSELAAGIGWATGRRREQKSERVLGSAAVVLLVGVGGVVCGATRAGRTGCETGAADQRGGFGWSDGSGTRVGSGTEYLIPYLGTK